MSQRISKPISEQPTTPTREQLTEQITEQVNRIPMKLIKRSPLNHNVYLIKLEAYGELPKLHSCCCVKIFDEENNAKSYSPLLWTNKVLTFAIKEYSKGIVSKYICNKKIGEDVFVSDVDFRRQIKPNEFNSVLMIAGGTGITPMYQMLREYFNVQYNMMNVTLLFLNKTKRDIFLYNQLEKLMRKSCGKLQIIHVLDDEMTPPEPELRQVCARLNKDSLLTLTHSKVFEFVYICGPPRLYDAFSGRKISKTEQGPLTGILKEMGYTENNVYKL